MAQRKKERKKENKKNNKNCPPTTNLATGKNNNTTKIALLNPYHKW